MNRLLVLLPVWAWLLLFVATPVLIVAALSVSTSVPGVPPYTPLLESPDPANYAVLTEEDPRSEDPATIRAAMLAGVLDVPEDRRAEVHEIGDRRAAIAAAVGLARPGDTVLVAGKGHETGQDVAGTVHPFDDRAVLREVLTPAKGSA